MTQKLSKLRLGIIGAGSVVREIYQHLYFRSRYSHLLEVCAVANPSEPNRHWLADLAGVPAAGRFADYRDMLKQVKLDAVQVNTPDHLHCAPAVAALEAGLEVIVAKPAAATGKEVATMLQTATRAERFLGVDFHKRDDPRIKEAAARFRSGRYGAFQSGVLYMLDKLLVADPNHSPRFFATPDFAAKNTPVSFLTVHLADALLHIVNLVPVQVRATGYAHKLPALKPVPVAGLDLVDTEVIFESGAIAHLIAGWALPNTAWSTTVQSVRLIGSEGLLDLNLDTPGLREVHAGGFSEINPLFRNFETDGTVSGYGISHPGRLYEQALRWRNGEMRAAERTNILTPAALGFHSTLVLEGAERSLAEGNRLTGGAVLGAPVDLRTLAARAGLT